MMTDCRACKFWEQGGDPDLGTCRRHAPRLIEGHFQQLPEDGCLPERQAIWPRTAEDECCGDGEPRDADTALRDRFAGQAMQALLRIGTTPPRDGKTFDWPDQPFYFGNWEPSDGAMGGVDALADDAYTIADAMLRQRQQTADHTTEGEETTEGREERERAGGRIGGEAEPKTHCNEPGQGRQEASGSAAAAPPHRSDNPATATSGGVFSPDPCCSVRPRGQQDRMT